MNEVQTVHILLSDFQYMREYERVCSFICLFGIGKKTRRKWLMRSMELWHKVFIIDLIDICYFTHQRRTHDRNYIIWTTAEIKNTSIIIQREKKTAHTAKSREQQTRWKRKISIYIYVHVDIMLLLQFSQ